MKLFSILSHGFLPVSPLTTLSKLEKIVITRAIGSSALTTLTSEWSVDKLAIDIMQSNNMWALSIIIIYAYGYYKLSEMVKPQLVNIPIYNRWSKNIESVLFIVFLVFTRDVQNAI
jgi:hypothetical protein